jgi:23S rRNA (guanine745-N1)-methyltransferase
VLQDKTWACVNGHRFDRAKEGYVNLLLAQHRNSKQPGDDKQMVLARRTFLSQGHYAPLAQALSELIVKHMAQDNEQLSLFDAGCGEGYYLDAILASLPGINGLAGQDKQLAEMVSVAGVDISKAAVGKAAKRMPQGQFAVGSTFALPLFDDSQDAVIQVFAPSDPQEIARVLKSDGVWITVDPAPRHLFELKACVYDAPQEHVIVTTVPNGFSLVEQAQLTFTMDLTQHNAAAEALLMMTPFYWRISEDKKARLPEQVNVVTADFAIKVMRIESA